MSNCLIAEYETNVAAMLGLEVLEKNDYTLENVSIVSSATDPAAKHLHNLPQDAGAKAATSAAPEGRSTALGMLIGGTLASPFAAGTLIGPFVIGGPLLGMAIGAAIGNLLESMDQWGVAQPTTQDYESRVKEGSVLIIVHDIDSSELNDAESLLKTTDPKTLERFEVT
ncbi:MAG: DUF1269 domain-containing protein [Pirellulaceae bacterium]|nr:DUF1269 domain-containing protein [Pirellulaceae bacterium]